MVCATVTNVFFVICTDRYNFVHAPIMALPGVMFTLKEVRSKPQVPTVDEIYGFVKTLFNKACLSSECSLVSRPVKICHGPVYTALLLLFIVYLVILLRY